MNKNIKAIVKLIQDCNNYWHKTGVIKSMNGPSTTKVSVGWPGYVSGLGFFPLYEDRFLALETQSQYTFKLIDDSLIQFYYEFHPVSQELILAKIAYYPFPSTTNTSEFRFDSDNKYFNPVAHPHNHFQIGSIPDLRLTSENVPLPGSFFELIMRNFYFDLYWAKRFPTSYPVIKDLTLTPEQKMQKLKALDYHMYLSGQKSQSTFVGHPEEFLKSIRINCKWD